jgi:hypothetical protein
MDVQTSWFDGTHATDAPVPVPFPTPLSRVYQGSMMPRLKRGSPARTRTRFAAVVDMVETE